MKLFVVIFLLGMATTFGILDFMLGQQANPLSLLLVVGAHAITTMDKR